MGNVCLVEKHVEKHVCSGGPVSLTHSCVSSVDVVDVVADYVLGSEVAVAAVVVVAVVLFAAAACALTATRFSVVGVVGVLRSACGRVLLSGSGF